MAPSDIGVGVDGEAEEVAAEAEIEYAGFWIRLLAAVIDGLVTLACVFVLVLMSLPIRLIIESAEGDGFAWVLTALGLLYYVVPTAIWGRTVGKLAVGIKVVNRNGRPPGLGRAILREVIGKFLSQVLLGIGYFWIAFNWRKRGWHDYIGGTWVVMT